MSTTEFEAFFEDLVSDAQHMAPQAFTAVAEALERWNRFEEAHLLSLPTLLIWGNQDTIVDRDAITRTLIAIPGAGNLEVLRGVGHSPMIEAPVILAERIIDFIAEDFEDFAEARQYAAERTTPAQDSNE
jgi:pimeloyl-ACP methyl ester carboxylesterase